MGSKAPEPRPDRSAGCVPATPAPPPRRSSPAYSQNPDAPFWNDNEYDHNALGHAIANVAKEASAEIEKLKQRVAALEKRIN